jgi:hypothetical protein
VLSEFGSRDSRGRATNVLLQDQKKGGKVHHFKGLFVLQGMDM